MNQKVEVASVLWRMARPTHLLLIAFVYLLGATMAMALGAAFEAQLLLVGLVVLLLVSSSVHYANEYADYEMDALTPRTWFSGGSGALPGSTVPRRVALRAGWVGLAAGSTPALFGWATGALNPTALYPLALGTFLGWMYSLPPEPRWRLYWAVAALFFLMFPLLVGWSIPARSRGAASWSDLWSFSVDTSTQNRAHRFLRLRR